MIVWLFLAMFLAFHAVFLLVVVAADAAGWLE